MKRESIRLGPGSLKNTSPYGYVFLLNIQPLRSFYNSNFINSYF